MLCCRTRQATAAVRNGTPHAAPGTTGSFQLGLTGLLAAQAQADMDALPSNAKLTRMPAICYWGMLGTLLTSGAIPEATLMGFAHIVVASSFARGPFQPVSLQVPNVLSALQADTSYLGRVSSERGRCVLTAQA